MTERIEIFGQEFSRMTDPALRLALKLEQSIHHGGWDQPPALYAVVRRGERLSLKEIPVPWDKAPEPGAIIENIGEQMTEPTEWGDLAARITAAYDGLYGLMCVVEAWERQREAIDDPRKAVDIPGSREIRNATIVTLHGRMFTVHRRRGEKPISGEITGFAGRMTGGLVLMIKAIAEHCPDDVVDREAVAGMAVVTDEEEIREKVRRWGQ